MPMSLDEGKFREVINWVELAEPLQKRRGQEVVRARDDGFGVLPPDTALGLVDLERHGERLEEICFQKRKRFLTIGSSIVSFGEREHFRKLLWASEFENQY